MYSKNDRVHHAALVIRSVSGHDHPVVRSLAYGCLVAAVLGCSAADRDTAATGAGPAAGSGGGGATAGTGGSGSGKGGGGALGLDAGMDAGTYTCSDDLTQILGEG